MGSHEKTLTIARADWGQPAADLLADCFTVPDALDKVARQVEEGAASLFTVDDGGAIVAAFVLRVEGDEGVIVAANSTEGIDMFVALLPHVEERFQGCSAVRFHTARPGLAKIMQAHGYAGQEVVLRKEIH